MAHEHDVNITDFQFEIDPITGEIIDKATSMIEIAQDNHNSVRFGFTIPRFVHGHDMSLCNKVEIHYINLDANGVDLSEDVYPVEDVQTSEDVVTFSWLISKNATVYAGTLAFLVKFKCLTGETLDYEWNTDIFDRVSISNGMDNSESVITNYSDVLEAWKREVLSEITPLVERAEQANINAKISETKAIEASERALDAAKVAVETVESIAEEAIEWEVGGISSANGDETTSSLRIRSDYIEVDAFVSAVVTNPSYVITYYVYDENKNFKRSLGSWVTMFTLDDVKGLYEDVGYIRMLFKKTSDAQVSVDTDIPLSGLTVVQSSIKRANVKVDEILAKSSFFDYSNCGLPVLYLDGDTSAMTKDNAVTLNYKYGERTGTCTCKWQGSSSVRLGYPKRNYTIKFDNAFEAKTGWGSQKKYCMKANWIDPSSARNIVNARLWGQIVASRGNAVTDGRKTSPNYGAVDGFPIIIIINGEFTGLYTHNIPKDAWMFGMGTGASEYIVCGESNHMLSSQFRALATFEGDETIGQLDYSIEYAPDGVVDSTVISSFNTLIGAALNVGSNWETALAPYLDIDSVFDYFIFVNCIGGIDNLGKNILYGTYDGTKWFMSAYDLDSTYGSGTYGTEWNPVVNTKNQFKESAQWHKLATLIYNYSKTRLKTRYKELRTSVLSDENVWYMLTNFVNAIPRGIYNSDSNKWSTMPATSTANVSGYMEFYRMHCAYLDKEIEALT